MLQNIPTLEQWQAADDKQRRLWRAQRWVNEESRLMPGYPLGEPYYEELLYGPQEDEEREKPVFAGSNVVQFGNEPIRKKSKSTPKKTTISTKKRKAA